MDLTFVPKNEFQPFSINFSNLDFTAELSDNTDLLKPWLSSPITLKGHLINSSREKEEVTLVPLGTTILRQIAFPVAD